MVIWTNEFQPSYICSEQKGKQQEKRINTREKKKVLVKAGETIKEKRQLPRSHLPKINERHTSHSLMQLPAKSSLLAQSFEHKINDKIH